jgi:dTDP-glucose 4,6-dehydratase
MNKYIVIGGSGFIGSHFIKLLIQKKKKVLNLDIQNNTFNKLNKDLKNYKFNFCDITNLEKLKRIIYKYKPNYIINFAAETHVDRSISDPNNFIQTNIIGTFNLLEILREKKIEVRYLHISTDEVFGSLSLKQKKFNKYSKYNPLNPYSASKASSDHLVKSFVNTFKIDALVTNCSNNFGEFQYPEKFIPLSILNCINNRKIKIYGNGKNIRDWIYVKDHCNILYKVLNKGLSGQSYLIGGNNELNNLEIARNIVKIVNNINNTNYQFKQIIEFIEDRPGHDFRYAIDSSNTEKLLKIKFKSNFDLNLRNTVNHYIRNIKIYNRIISKDNWFKK